MALTATPAAAQDAAATENTADADAATAPIREAFFARMKEGRTGEALEALFVKAGQSLIKPVALSDLERQFDNAITLYGPLRECHVYQQESAATLLASYRYLCQHDRMITRWHLTFIRLPNGWQGGYIKFDDKFSDVLGKN
ncbi:hypothetical protein [Paraurantiacibacter namhicola]|nr:hypothetical protein [Paraurantiacibacter namhicola]